MLNPAKLNTHPVLIFCPASEDAMQVSRLFRNAFISHRICSGAEELKPDVSRHAGAVFIAEEYLVQSVLVQIAHLIDAQPPWSDLPFLVLTTPGADSALARKASSLMRNVTLIERPIHAAALISVTQTTLRSRARQFQLMGYIEQREKALRQKEEALAELRRSDEGKDRFLAILAHELRNPLAPIKNAVAVMRLREIGDEQSRWARDIIDRQVTLLTRLVNDLLDISRVTRGTLALQREKVPVKSVLEGALETSMPLVRAKGLELKVDMPEEDIEFDVDRVRIAQAISNLLINAVKYTPAPGSISLKVSYTDDEVVISVSDTGIGISTRDLARIFDMFVQTDASRDRMQGGLGIGLTLARQFAELHGGTISASSNGPGMGSRFTLRIPHVQHAATQYYPDDYSDAALIRRGLARPGAAQLAH